MSPRRRIRGVGFQRQNTGFHPFTSSSLPRKFGSQGAGSVRTDRWPQHSVPRDHGAERGVSLMAANFRVLVHRNSDNLHLRLAGDFDGSSAQQLLCVIGDNGNGVRRVFIHTSGLAEIHPFGKAVFQKNLRGFMQPQTDVVFTGEKGPEIATR